MAARNFSPAFMQWIATQPPEADVDQAVLAWNGALEFAAEMADGQLPNRPVGMCKLSLKFRRLLQCEPPLQKLERARG